VGDSTLRGRTAAFLLLVIVTNVAGNLSLSHGMKQPGSGVLTALIDPWVLGGIALLVVWTVSRMALLRWADLSYVLPVTALGYVLNALAGRFLLQETVSWERWAGTLLIVAGAALAGSTQPDSGEQS
jgi:drug/metabolite transporter (DMT)-like permease